MRTISILNTLVICGMAAVAGLGSNNHDYFGYRLTGSYVYGLSSLVGLAVAIGFNIPIWSLYFDLQLLKRGIDIAEGRMGLYLQETAVINFATQNFDKVAIRKCC